MGEYQQFAFILAEDNNTVGNPIITSSATYTTNGEYMSSITDSRGNTTSYMYNESRGHLLSETNAKNVTTQYTYNNSELLSGVNVANGDTTSSVGYTYDSSKRLTSILSPSGITYNFTYDSFGRSTTTKVGTRLLSQYAYNNQGLVNSMTYGNGIVMSYGYDELNRQTTKYINNTLRYECVYDGSSRLIEVKDLSLNRIIKYGYDLVNRLVSEKVIDATSMLVLSELHIYYDDSKNRISGYTVDIDGEEKRIDYVYSSDEAMPDLITGVKLNDSQVLSYTFDGLKRLETRTIETDAPFTTVYEYIYGAENGTTTTLVDLMQNADEMLWYTYDELGNITSVTKDETLLESYTYDNLNQLKTVTRGSDTYEYIYDNGGNILFVKKNGEVIKTYTYDDSEWKDLLTAYNGETITYDAIGNPLIYRGDMNFTWTDGRKLSGVTKGTDSISYTYDANGLRTSKTVNGTTTEYCWLNGVLQEQKTGNDSLAFLYDESGTAFGFIYQNEFEESYYYYEFNVQGDIIGIIDSEGERIVRYVYNEWGEVVDITGQLADTIGQINPLRYRGYYYDEETGFYLTGSRYYDPEIGRFINVDGYVSTGQDINGFNMFSYCGNNPVNRIDPTGMLWSSIKNTASKAWKKVKKWLKNTFTADVKTSTDIPLIEVGEIVNLKVGIRGTATTENNTNNNKPISIYTSSTISGTNCVSSGRGIKNNIINTDVYFGTDGMSYSKSNNFSFCETSVTYSLLTDGRLGCEYGYIITWDNIEYTAYISGSSMWQIQAFALAIATGEWQALPTLIPALQPLK